MAELQILPVGLAAGMVKTYNQLPRKLIGFVDHITFGSFTLDPKTGNKEPTYWFDEETDNSINAVGLTNQGLQKFLDEDLPFIVELMRDSETKIHISLAPAIGGDLRKMVAMINASPYRDLIAKIEINAACPNHRNEDGVLHKVLAHDLVAVEKLMQETTGLERPKMIKVSPKMEPSIIGEYPALCSEFGFTGIVSGNTLPGSSHIKGKKRLSVDTGGLAGEILRKDCINQVATIAYFCKKAGIEIIACGGISTGLTVERNLASGASVCQLATAWMQHGERAFQSIAQEMFS